MQSDVNKRRAERQRLARKRRLMIVSLFLVALTLITLVILCFTAFFPIKNINVSGSEKYTEQQIADAAQIKSKNLFTISKKKVENNIRQALPYVESIELKRKLPDKVVITVKEAEEFAFYKSGENYFIISELGYILKQQAEIPENIFQIMTDGMSGNVSEMVTYTHSDEEELLKKLISELAEHNIVINKIDVTSTIQIVLEVDNRFTVWLGSDEYITEKIDCLATTIDDMNNRGETTQKCIIKLDSWEPAYRYVFIEPIND